MKFSILSLFFRKADVYNGERLLVKNFHNKCKDFVSNLEL